VWGEDRHHAIARLERALGELQIEGLKTTKPLFVALARDETIRSGKFHTRWLEGWLEANASKLG
jgi:acetyl-CoA carboxylase biotin carboxylase subunit